MGREVGSNVVGWPVGRRIGEGTRGDRSRRRQSEEVLVHHRPLLRDCPGVGGGAVKDFVLLPQVLIEFELECVSGIEIGT
jgi:hypothetical protein